MLSYAMGIIRLLCKTEFVMPLETVQREQSKLGNSGSLDEASYAVISSSGLFVMSVPSKISCSKNVYTYF